MGIGIIFDVLKLALPGLQKSIEVWTNRKHYTREEIAAKVQQEQAALQAWKDQAAKDRELAYGKK